MAVTLPPVAHFTKYQKHLVAGVVGAGGGWQGEEDAFVLKLNQLSEPVIQA